MKYYLFAGDCYYAKGGSRDYIASSTNMWELVDRGERFILISKEKDELQTVWFHVADENMKIVHQSIPQAHSY